MMAILTGVRSYFIAVLIVISLIMSAALNMPANLENSAVATGLEKVSFHANSLRKAMPKNAQTTAQLHSSHMLANKAQNSPSQASKVPVL